MQKTTHERHLTGVNWPTNRSRCRGARVGLSTGIGSAQRSGEEGWGYSPPHCEESWQHQMARYARARTFSKVMAIDRLSLTTSTPHADRDLKMEAVWWRCVPVGGHDDRVEVAENRTVTQYPVVVASVHMYVSIASPYHTTRVQSLASTLHTRPEDKIVRYSPLSSTLLSWHTQVHATLVSRPSSIPCLHAVLMLLRSSGP